VSKKLPGKKVIGILCREFGFSFISQKGSHTKLKKKLGGREITTIVPLHKELAHGTLSGALELAEVEIDDF